MRGAHVVGASGLEVAAHASRLDVDDRARADRDRLGARRAQTTIDSSRQIGVRDDLRELGVIAHVLLGQRLLDQQQVERVELREVVRVGERVRGVGVDLQQDVAEPLAHRADGFDVPARARSSA